ncbi:MAG: sigma-70 family RNA polymerase sigma factor [Firmicutes bacterium]|nr:sigma-70 family RNA polymerase sigma factor [Bacillota bacterium]
MRKLDGELLPHLEQNELRQLLSRAQAGDSVAREQVLRHNLLLVKNILPRFAGAELQEDLFQVGAIGLLKAIDDFDLDRNLMFSTYAVPKIIGEIKMYLRANNPVKVSRDLLRISGQVKKCRRQLEQDLGREPTVAEVARELRLSTEEVAAAETAVESPASLDAVTATVSMDDFRIALKDAISRLETRERQVITLRYFSELSQAQVAQKLGISQGHVSRIERQVLSKIKASWG